MAGDARVGNYGCHKFAPYAVLLVRGANEEPSVTGNLDGVQTRKFTYFFQSKLKIDFCFAARWDLTAIIRRICDRGVDAGFVELSVVNWRREVAVESQLGIFRRN